MLRKRDSEDGPVALTELLAAAAVATPGQLVDALSQRGDAVVVDSLGRLAVPLPVAERLWAEQEERERIAAEEFEAAEKIRLANLKAQVEQQEALKLQQAKEALIRERQMRVEQAAGIPLWQVEQEIRKARVRGGMTYAELGREMDKPISLVEAEEFIRATYGAEALERGDAT